MAAFFFNCSEGYIVYFQCSTASKDSTLGTATVGWGRFEFNNDAPLDEDDNDVEGQASGCI